MNALHPNSTFYADGYQDASCGDAASPPDVSVYAMEYAQGYLDGTAARKTEGK